MAETTAQLTEKKLTTIQKGVVVSNRMAKTLVVSVDTLKTHPKYQKRYISTKKFKVHAPEGEYQIGQVVYFRECRPLSKEKHHIIVNA